MIRHSELLKQSRSEIAAQAVRASGGEVPLALAESVVDAAAEAMEAQTPMSGDRLPPLPDANGVRDQLLRCVETSCLDCLYEGGDGEQTRAFARALREKFHALYTRQPLPPGPALFSELDDPSAPPPSSELAPLHRFVSTLLSSVGEMVYVHDEAGRLRYANERCAEVTGYSREELLAPMSIQDFLPPEYGDLVADRLATLGAGKQSPFTLEILNRWGQRVPLEFSLHHLPLSPGEGPPEDFVLVCAHDCHLSRRLERRIEAMDDLEQRVLETIPIGVIVTDDALVIADANPCAVRIIGAPSRQELVGTPIYTVCGDDDPAMRAKLTSVLETRKEWHSEWHGKTRFGGGMHNQLIVLPMGGNRAA